MNTGTTIPPLTVSGSDPSQTPAPGPNQIICPLRRGQQVTYPAGTVATSTHPRRHGPYALRRAVTVTIRMASDGYIDLWNDKKRGTGLVCLPYATHAGAGGYWVDIRLTPELCEALGVATPTLPVLSAYDRDSLDIEPCFGHGYDDRWVLPSH